MLGFEIDLFHLLPREPADDRRQHSDRGDEPCATGIGDETVADVVFPHGRTAVEWKRGAALRPEGKFPASQSLEKSQNAEGISIPVGSSVAVSEEDAAEPIVDLSNRGVAVAGIAGARG
jgi:hypothetical protein